METENIIIRRETERDYRVVENLIREAFWNVYRLGDPAGGMPPYPRSSAIRAAMSSAL